MNSLLEIQNELESFMRGQLSNKENSLWDRLVKSSVKIDGTGCDGIIMGTSINSFWNTNTGIFFRYKAPKTPACRRGREFGIAK